jgi:hypothetical protein
MTPRPKPIKQIGLKAHLNADNTLYTRYDIYVMSREANVSRKGRARMFKIHEDTMRKWDSYDDAESVTIQL